MTLVYVALGSNLGVSKSHLNNAITALKTIAKPNSWQLSRWYRSQAIGGPENQPDYTNAVCAFDTDLSPESLLKELQKIEALEGRERLVRWGPRTLDLDIIWMDGIERSTDILTLPHPRAHERAFVLRPLIDLQAAILLNDTPLPTLLADVSDQILAPVDL